MGVEKGRNSGSGYNTPLVNEKRLDGGTVPESAIYGHVVLGKKVIS